MLTNNAGVGHHMPFTALPADEARDREVIVYCACPNEASAAPVAKQLKRSGLLKVRPLTGDMLAWKDAVFDVQAEPTPLRVPKPGFSA